MYYIYQFLDKSENVIYVGYTGDIKTRICVQHFGGIGHLSNECYEQVFMVVYSECVSIDDAKVKERYLINKLSPKYNMKLNNQSKFSFEIEISDWRYLPIDKKSLLKKKVSSGKITLKNTDVEITYKSYKKLNDKEIQVFKKINTNAVLLKETKSSFNKIYKLSIICINNKVWAFHQQIYNFIVESQNTNLGVPSLISLVNNNILRSDEIAIVNDANTIKNNLSPYCGSAYSNIGIYANSTVLISLENALKLVKFYISKELEIYSRKFERNKEIVYDNWRTERRVFYDFEEFQSFCIKNNTYLGQRLKRAKYIEKSLGQKFEII